jgi:RNA polymerase sigma-70 factor (ECF subfamily)
LNHHDDRKLIAQVVAGQPEALGDLHQRYRQQLAGFLRVRLNISSEEAEDIVQDTFASLLANDHAALRRYEGRAAFYTYLCAIALRLAYRRFRRQPMQVELKADREAPELAHDPTASGLTALDVRRALDVLPEQFRTALMLHHFGGMEYHEIAKLLRVPINTISTRIYRAKRRLHEMLSA